MTEIIDTPITQEQVDFIKQDLLDKSVHNIYKLPEPQENETVGDWFERAISTYNSYENNHTSTYLRDVYDFLNGNLDKFNVENDNSITDENISNRHDTSILSTYLNFPQPKPLGMATTSKDHRVRIDQWMAHLGKADQAQALVDKYGLDVAYKICQQSMLAPADLKDVTGGTSLSSKNAVQYFLDNEVSAESLASIPGLNAETVRASLQSVAPVVEEVVVEAPVVETVVPGEERAEEVVEAITPILEEAGILDVLGNVELDPDGSLNRDSLHAELASMTPSESEQFFDPASYFSNDKLRRRMEKRAERNGQTLGEYLDDRAERKGVSAEEFVADKEEKIEKREAKRDAFVNGAREFFGL